MSISHDLICDGIIKSSSDMSADSYMSQWARATTENNQLSCLRVIVLHGQPPLSDVVWDYLQDLPALSMVLTYDCHELVQGWQESRKLGIWSSRTNKELGEYLLPYGLAKKDKSWSSLLCAVYRSGESYFTEQSDARISERLTHLPILQLALGPSNIERSKKFVSFQRIDIGPTRKRKLPSTLAQVKQQKTKTSGVSQMKGCREIAEALESFIRFE